MRARRSVIAATAAGVALAGLALPGAFETVDARPKLGGDFIDRGSIQVHIWCPSEHQYYGFDASFVADSEEALLVFTMVNHQGGTWYNQAIDNVAIVERSVYEAYRFHAEPDSFLCIYESGPDSVFFFETADSLGLVNALYTFDEGVDPAWDLSGGAYFDASRSAPKNLYAPTGTNGGGSLGVGMLGDPSPLVTTSVLVHGLDPGTEYVVSLWCVNDDSGGSNPDDIVLDVYGAERWVAVTDPVVTASGDTYGVAWVDTDADDDLDLYLSNRLTQPNVVLVQGPSGTFTAETSHALASAALDRGGAFGDIDDDGDLDAFVPGDTPSVNAFYRNDPTGFVAIQMATLAGIVAPNRSTFGDVDRDGDVDLYVACDGANALLLNQSSGGSLSFTNATVAPLDDPHQSEDCALLDVDLDGDLDVAVSDRDLGVRLFRNDGATFVDATDPVLAVVGAATTMAWGDADTDGDYDLFLVVPGGSRLFRNDGASAFADVTGTAALVTQQVETPSWVDADNDGDEDLFLVQSGPERLYRNEGTYAFLPIDDTSHDVLAALDAAWGDYDDDGDLDVYIGNFDSEIGTNRLVRNESFAAGRHWLHVDLEGTVSNRSGVGARVEVTAAGAATQVRQVGGALSGTRGFDSLTEEVGLGALSTADVRVVWPSGIVQEVPQVAADQRITLEEPDLVLSDAVGADTCDGGTPNGVWEPGEVIELPLPLSAIGTRTHTGATGLLGTTTPGVTVLDAFVTWPAIAPGTPVPADGPGVRVRVDLSVPCFSIADLILDVTTDQGGPYRYRFAEAIGRRATAVPSLPIPDGTTSPAVSRLVIPSDVVLTDVNVRAYVDHPRVGDLRMVLESPDGTRVRLIDRPGYPASAFGCADATVDVVFDDEATTPLETWCNGQSPWSPSAGRPLDPLAAFDGEHTRGTWTLTVTDHLTLGASAGTLVQWTLLTTPALPGEACAGCASVTSADASEPPARFALGASRPNPARRATAIPFELPGREAATLRIFDVTGRLVRTLVKGTLASGPHVARWEGRDGTGRTVAPGVYYYVLDDGTMRLVRRLQLIR